MASSDQDPLGLQTLWIPDAPIIGLTDIAARALAHFGAEQASPLLAPALAAVADLLAAFDSQEPASLKSPTGVAPTKVGMLLDSIRSHESPDPKLQSAHLLAALALSELRDACLLIGAKLKTTPTRGAGPVMSLLTGPMTEEAYWRSEDLTQRATVHAMTALEAVTAADLVVEMDLWKRAFERTLDSHCAREQAEAARTEAAICAARSAALSEAQRKRARDRHTEHYAMQNDLKAWYLAHRHEFRTMKAAIDAAEKVVPLKTDTIRKRLIQIRKELASAG